MSDDLAVPGVDFTGGSSYASNPPLNDGVDEKPSAGVDPSPFGVNREEPLDEDDFAVMTRQEANNKVSIASTKDLGLWQRVRALIQMGGIAACFRSTVGDRKQADSEDWISRHPKALDSSDTASSLPNRKKQNENLFDDFYKKPDHSNEDEEVPTVGERKITISLNGETIPIKVQVQYGKRDGLPKRWFAERLTGDRERIDPQSPLGLAVDKTVSRWSFNQSQNSLSHLE